MSKHDSAQDTAPVRIKKYPNRRLYHTSNSRYIVLDDIVAMVKNGQEFFVEDTKTGADITRSILNQVIYEREAANADFHFPLDVQKQLILMYDDAYGKMMPDYLSQSIKLFASERSKMKDAFEEMVSYNSKNMAEFSDRLATQNIAYFENAWDFFQSVSGIASSGSTISKSEDSIDETTDKAALLDDIQSQITALQEKLEKLNKQN